MTIDEMKNWIDNASFEQLLSKWRFAPIGDPFFQQEIGDYYAKKMIEKKALISNEEYSDISKKVGWEIAL